MDERIKEARKTCNNCYVKIAQARKRIATLEYCSAQQQAIIDSIKMEEES